MNGDGGPAGRGERRRGPEAAIALGQLALVVLGAAALLWPAWLNGYPLVFQDSAWYLSPFWGGGGWHPGRTIGYSLFARAALEVRSLWSVVAAQALVTSALMVAVAAAGAGRGWARVALPAAALLAVLLLSGAAKYVSWLMADVTTSWLFLAGALWLCSRRTLLRATALLVAAIAVPAHNSHVPLALATSAGVAVGAWLLLPRGHAVRGSARTLLVLGLLSVPWTAGVHALFGSPGVLRGTGSFLMYRFIDTGVVPTTLDRYCDEKAWKSCRYRDEFARHVGRADGWFLFRASSPFKTELGRWEGEEQAEIVAHAFRCCWPEIARTTAIGSWEQFWRIDSSDGLSPRDTGPIHAFLERHLSRELPALEGSRQRRGDPVPTTLHGAPEVALHGVLVFAAVGLAGWAWATGRRSTALFLASAMLFLVANALVCGFGSSTHDRYQGRVAWLLPFAIAVSVGGLLEDRGRRGPSGTTGRDAPAV